MIVEGVRVAESPDRPGHFRATATVRTEGGWKGYRAEAWYDVPPLPGVDPGRSADPWLVLLLPCAMARGEDLRLPLPADPLLLEHCRALARTWGAWRGQRPAVVHAPAGATPPPPPGGRRGAFFTGGVDSWYTLLRSDEEAAAGTGPGAVDALVYVVGYDIPEAEREAARRKVESLRRVAGEAGRELVVLATNVRATPLHRGVSWGPVWHGPALGAAGHFLAPPFRRILVPASFGPGEFDAPWGSTPEEDPLMSSAALSFHHHGTDRSRLGKTLYLAARPEAAALHVCWSGGNDRNCGGCEKCLRTMTALEVAGALRGSPAFAGTPFSPERLRRVPLDGAGAPAFWKDLLQGAREEGREDVAEAVEECLRWNGEVERAVARVALLGRVPGLARLGSSLAKRLRRRLRSKAGG